MSLLILGIILFLGIHLIRVVIPGFRRSMIAILGEAGWKIGYSIASIATLIRLIYGFGQARDSTPIWSPPFWMSHITILLMLFALICLVASLLPAGHIAVRTKHPMVLSVKIWAFAHLLSNGERRIDDIDSHSRVSDQNGVRTVWAQGSRGRSEPCGAVWRHPARLEYHGLVRSGARRSAVPYARP